MLAAGIALRLALAFVIFPGQGFAGDLELHTQWLTVLAEFGPGGFYAHTREVLPPGFAWLLWPLALVGRFIESAAGIPLPASAWALVKAPALIADVLIAVLLFRVTSRWASARAGLLAAALFLFIPVTWYESALWGQIDATGTLFVLAALVALDLGWSEAAVAAAVVASLIKPQFGISLIVVALVLARRYLGVDPRPLMTSLVVGVVAAVLVVLPFDLEARAPSGLAGTPIVGEAAGLLTIVGEQAGKDKVLVANAFTPWALVGPNPLPKSGIAHWTGDDLRLVGDTTAFAIGLWLAGTAFFAGGALLLVRPERPTTNLVAVVFLTVALFLLATRVHERYVYPVFAVAAPLAAVSWLWRPWYVLVGMATAINLHGVLTYGGTLGVIGMPFGHDAQTATTITAIAIAQGLLGVFLAGLVVADAGGGSLAGRTLPTVRGGRAWFPRSRAATPSSVPPA